MICFFCRGTACLREAASAKAGAPCPYYLSKQISIAMSLIFSKIFFFL
jgi:hypothetical protein